MAVKRTTDKELGTKKKEGVTPGGRKYSITKYGPGSTRTEVESHNSKYGRTQIKSRMKGKTHKSEFTPTGPPGNSDRFRTIKKGYTKKAR